MLKIGDYLKRITKEYDPEKEKEVTITEYFLVLSVNDDIINVTYHNGTPLAEVITNDEELGKIFSYDEIAEKAQIIKLSQRRILPEYTVEGDLKISTKRKVSRVVNGISSLEDEALVYEWENNKVEIPIPRYYYNGEHILKLGGLYNGKSKINRIS